MKSRMAFSIALSLSLVSCLMHGQTNISTKAPPSFYTTDPQAPLGSEKHPARISSGIVASQAIQQPKPLYPAGTNTSGGIVVRILINPEGKVTRTDVISGHEAMWEPTTKAIRQWTYKPILLNGIPVWVETVVTIVT